MTNSSSKQGEPELKECPLVHPIKEGLNVWESSAGRKWHIWCNDCGLQFEGHYGQSKDEVIKKWNTRLPVASTAPGVDRKLFDELLVAFDSTRMGEKGINQGCWCVSSPTQTNQSDWKHEKHCKRNMALLKRCEAAASPAPLVSDCEGESD